MLCALCSKPTLLLKTMDSQLEAARQDIRSVQRKLVKTEQNLAAAEQAGNKEKETLLFDLLLSLNNQLSGLQEKENILLRRQARGNHGFQLVHAGLLVLSSCCTPFTE